MGEVSAGSIFCPSKGQVSNRRFIERMKEWGWTVNKVKGDWTEMIHLNTYDKVKVRSAQITTGNPPEVFQEVLDVMNLTWEQFMLTNIPEVMSKIVEQDAFVRGTEQFLLGERDRLPQRMLDILHEEALQEYGKHQRRVERKAREAAAREQKEKQRIMSQPSTSESEVIDLTDVDIHAELARVTNPVKGETRDTPTRVRVINRVFDYLVESGEPCSAQRISDALGDTSKESVTGALLGLVKHELVERVKPGIYRIVRDQQNGSTIHHNVTAPVPVAPVQPVAALAPAPTTPVFPAGPWAGSVASTGDLTSAEEGVINDVLDLMFPDGMRIRAADISLLDQWKHLTAEVMRRVGG